MSERIPTNLRTLLILEVLGKSDVPMTPTEINAEIGLPKQTVHRLCATLEAEGFIARDSHSSRFRPSRRLRLLGSGLIHGSHAHIARHQVLKSIAAAVNESVNFVIPEEGGMRYLDRVETGWPFRIQLPVGTNVPFHATASGKVFMASLEPSARRAFVSALELEPMTASTLVNPQSLLDQLSEIADQGYALDHEEFMTDMVAIAVPITDSHGRYVASLACHGPKQRMSTSDAMSYRDTLIQGAHRLQLALFEGSGDEQNLGS